MIRFRVPKDPRLLTRALWPVGRATTRSGLFAARPTYWMFWARNAIFHGLRALRIQPGETVLVPSYHCATAVEPILAHGARVEYYAVRRDLTIDAEDLRSRIDGRTRAVLAIHYFGFPQPLAGLRALFVERDLRLIEDCAHVLEGRFDSGEALGSVGDVSVFSWRKFLPTYDGGQLVLNDTRLHVSIPWDRPGFLVQAKVASNLAERWMADNRAGLLLRPLAALARVPAAALRALLARRADRPRALELQNYRMDFDPAAANTPLSPLSRYIIDHADIADIVRRRRANYARLGRAIDARAGLTPQFPTLPDGACPWAFPVLAPGRPDFHVRLRERGLEAFTWGDVIHPSLPLEQFPDARFLYRELILLPVHQDLSDRDFEDMERILDEALRCPDGAGRPAAPAEGGARP